ncbi:MULTISPECIES: multidrug efflux SMR transporter [unclassified Bacillus (in: firmicutes)]|uniref:DMT family transporter n=1 Tax=unclassified Bacillus (in: firmicutes) TaxID=185979 RepID=UPI000BEF32A0|nr:MULTISPECIES: multidrug efflux SMR transporter [unclassified Bacillus (in: firmicutes)]PEJ56118.1 ligand-binding protein SH3 [Bacillus sp. AFS002410]PEK98606.1 ligand-binding protein SH3 [Bacillus sp. AFS017336]
MNWIYLVIAGMSEIAWAFGLKYSDGFTNVIPTILTIAGIVFSFYLFSKAVREIPIGTAYAVFTGIGAAGTVIIGMLFLDEAASTLKIILVITLLSGIVGLKLTSNDKKPEKGDAA